MIRKILSVVIILIALFLVIRGWWTSQFSPVSTDKTNQIFVVEKNESFSQIAGRLKKAGLIRSAWAFSILAKQKGESDKIQSGTFRLSPSQSSEEILKDLTNQPLDRWVTLIEGWRVEEMAQRLQSELGIGEKEFITASKEGYMFPDTYLFPKEYSTSRIVQTMEDNFDQKYSTDIKAKIRALGLTEKEGVILASIVEREGRSSKVRQEVASILLKRLKIGMGLNVDATIQYALGYQPAEKSWWKRHLNNEDKKIDSPYNTYLYKGLPPTPICNPSLSSLEAVANANPDTPYLYYYHDSQGNSHYARTLEEHNQNVANYP